MQICTETSYSNEELRAEINRLKLAVQRASSPPEAPDDEGAPAPSPGRVLHLLKHSQWTVLHAAGRRQACLPQV